MFVCNRIFELFQNGLKNHASDDLEFCWWLFTNLDHDKDAGKRTIYRLKFKYFKLLSQMAIDWPIYSNYHYFKIICEQENVDKLSLSYPPDK